MNPKKITCLFDTTLVKISTQFSWGIGFIHYKHNIIITNEHLVRRQKSVFIQGRKLNKCRAKVLFVDEKLDLAFLECPPEYSYKSTTIEIEHQIGSGETIYSLGYTKKSFIEGQLYDNINSRNPIKHFKSIADITTTNLVGPLVNHMGNIVGIHIFYPQETNKLNYVLPSIKIHDSITKYLHSDRKLKIKCPKCLNIYFEQNGILESCPTCKSQIKSLFEFEKFSSIGVTRIVEDVITSLGYDVNLVCQGINNWVLERGSSSLNISYAQKNGIIMADAYLCTLPDDNLDVIYNFLLQQNNILNGISFSIKNQNIILSLIVFEQHLNTLTLKNMVENLILQADRYDNILVEEYGAKWRN